ncbi:hypothetical protein G6F70_004996 [Rhizopus microsporus]|uniref:Yeast cell wall synthesis Kre9/Knh1-like N-terminal domain-containing protein n=2 Tax=Rhizopus TaxID=4842 RepID=A0A367J4G1_RHIAZ|nr:hypothetical protein G6F71_005983 [Rhizopus microsporus]RCH84854.1 hypothetical protein CU097_007439 [Rhizopus azygosporus]KAG1199348.1 hypothetical protein G6F70_004996 [Rhizopus microsporus]KAG1209792.1 hypothetical protein G6F69_006039 [Rhizopus microsporus]KAG1233040.1 hypothetical protein G6F67_004553 [Rhizopus microsporus]
MRFTTFKIFLALFTAVVSAQSSPFYITNPIQGSSFKAGSIATITWLNGTPGNATVYVLTGNNPAAMTITGIKFTINGQDGKYNWKVPTDLLQNTTYSLMISYSTENGNTATAYSSSFTVIGSAGSAASQLPVSSAVSNASSVIVSSTAISSSAPSTTIVLTTSSSSSIPNTSASTIGASSTAAITQPATTTPRPSSDTISRHKASFTIINCMIALIAYVLYM